MTANCQSIKVTVRYQSYCSECPSLKNLQTVNAGEDVGKRETSITAGAAVWQLLKKLKIELLYDPAAPLLGIHPEKTIIQNDTCMPLFTAAVYNSQDM